jgi:hypothetical protein
MIKILHASNPPSNPVDLQTAWYAHHIQRTLLSFLFAGFRAPIDTAVNTAMNRKILQVHM